MIFNHSRFSEINEEELLSNIDKVVINKDKLNIMDFGCGLASLYKKLNYKKFILYDQNEQALEFHRNENSSDVIIISSLDELKKQGLNIDIVLFNSVIQYIRKDDLAEIIYFFIKQFPSIKIIISDIPKHNRFLEFLYLLFTNTNDIITIYKDIIENILKKDYKELDFFIHKPDFFESIKDLDIKIMRNFYLFKTRYSIIIAKSETE
ncbi:MAG: hypothetical protein VX984_02705 [Thermodesulfobacteriota bacterium]|nr:hypothetical protein [Thermodesulfobacteriota bacterium]